MEAVIRAFVGYILMMLMLRVVGRRPGKELPPFEFVLNSFSGGLALTAIVGDERSFTNAAARGKLVGSIFDVKYAILERNGTISIIPREA